MYIKRYTCQATEHSMAIVLLFLSTVRFSTHMKEFNIMNEPILQEAPSVTSSKCFSSIPQEEIKAV